MAAKIFRIQSEDPVNLALEELDINPKDNPTLNLEKPLAASLFVSGDDLSEQDFFIPVYNKVGWLGELPADYKITFLDLPGQNVLH